MLTTSWKSQIQERNHTIKRRTFVKSVAGAVAAGISRTARSAETVAAPSSLKNHADLFARDLQAAALAWFKEARFGLFMHYGLYSLLGRGEWVMFHEQIPIAEYEQLKDRFRADKFDADFITDLAAAAGMRYVNITARHHDGFCLFASKHSDYTDRPFRETNAMTCFSTEFLRHWRADFGDAPPLLRGEYADDDHDGLPNWFEMYWFGKFLDWSTATVADPKAPGKDGKTNLQHYVEQTAPVDFPSTGPSGKR